MKISTLQMNAGLLSLSDLSPVCCPTFSKSSIATDKVCKFHAAFALGKLHTGRSRNDQVATDMRIWLLEQVEKLEQFLKDVIRILVSRAEGEIDHVMPGYTHLQVRRASTSQLTEPKLNF